MRDFSRPVVFLGPSMALEDAREVVAADYRPPIERGDLAEIPSGALVGIVDGVFQQSAAVSPREVHRAVARGVQIYGASSMGALRALEVRGVIGVGRIYEMYRDGLIISDDEVALTLDPDSKKPLTQPLVNVRFAVDQLVRSGTLNRDLGDSIVRAAIQLHFSERTYPMIMDRAGLAARTDIHDLITMLQRFDLKREDAHALLQRLSQLVAGGWEGPADAAGPGDTEPDYGASDRFSDIRSAAILAPDAPISIWETGDHIEFAELVLFLHMTGKFERHARNALARFAMDGNELDAVEVADHAAQSLFANTAHCWGWMTSEEAQVTTRDLGLGLDDLGERCGEEMMARAVVHAIATDAPEEFLRALRAELFLDDLALKREAMRLGSLRSLARQGRALGPPTPEEVAHARGRLAAVNRLDWSRLQEQLAHYCVSPDAVAAFVDQLACARRAARESHRRVACAGLTAADPPRGRSMGLKSSPKAEGDARHCLAIGDALSATERLREVVGVTRVGMIGELGARGIEISQAARPSGIWSSTYGSGKGETRDAAIVGGVMEEVEKWAQEQFRPAPDELTMASYSALGDRAVDPGLLDLPYDSCYHRELEFAWYPCWNLLSDRQVLVPLTFLAPFRCTNDIYYSPRGCRRLFGTNGLASGFTLEEALVHAMCELVERHASRRHAIATTNPGIDFAPGERQFLDPGAYPAVLARLVRALEDEGTRRVLLEDITGEIGIPVIAATLFVEGVDDWAPCFGWGAHPNPEVAGRMALFEAAQSWICTIAGGREDLTINARSLGRHQRPRPYRFPLHVHCEDPDKRLIDTRQVGGLLSDDAHEEVVWLLDRLRRAGFEHVLAIDLSRPEIAPARVCRVVIPGLDTTNPFYICPRNRMALLGDLLPPRPGRPPA